MKITQINVQNFQGLRSACMTLPASIALVTGMNGAGKSSLRDAIAMAISGKPTRVTKKKDFADLVTDGSKTGSIQLTFADGRRSEVALPEGKVTFYGADKFEDIDKARAGLAYALDPALFAFAEEDERRLLLFTLTGCGASAEEVQKRMKARGADMAKVDAVLPLIHAGFPAAEKDAKSRATEAKGAWRAVTGETYGDKKAASFSVAKQEVDAGAISQAEQDIEEVDGAIATAQQQLGELQANYKAQQGRASQIAALEEQAGKLERMQQKLAADQTELAEWEAKVADAQAKAAGRHVEGHHECPHCQGLLQIKGQGLFAELVPYEIPDSTPDAEAVAKLPEYQKARDLCARTVENSKRALVAAQQADAQLQALTGSDDAAVSEDDIRGKQAKVDLLRASRKQLAADLEVLRTQQRAAAEADKKTADAKRHHADVQAWTLIADALAPDGIPGEILTDALRPVNDLLFEYAKLAGWQRVQLGSDMAITADGRQYCLLSESEKWRVDCLLALVVAKLSGLKLVVLDRFDVLDVAGRKDLLALLDELAFSGDLDTAVVCGTLKQAPTRLHDTMASFWVKNGEVEAVKLEEERAAA